MQLFKNIFRFEWRQFLRQPVQLFMLVFFLLLGIYSLNNGYEFIEHQQSGLDSLEENRQAHLKDIISRFHTDTTTAKGKMMASQAGLPQVVEFGAAPIAIHPPHGLALMAIGQRDLLPHFDIVNVQRNILTPPNAEIANPEKLASGNFDFSFVLIYLFPLLIIVLSYNIFSRESEQQTDRLLAIQGANMNLILIYKLLFRLILIAVLAWITIITGFIIHPSFTNLNGMDAFLWWFSVNSYLIFWFSVCWLVITLRKSSRINALSLLGTWLILTLLLPAIINKISGITRPMPLRTELASKQREIIYHTWEMPIPQLLTIFYQNNAQYRKLKSTTDTAQYGNKRFVAYYDLLDRRTTSNIDKYDRAAQRHNTLLGNMALFNPVAQMQNVLNAAAQTGLSDFLFYQKQVNSFQKQWVIYMNSYLLYNKKLSIHDVKTLPRFTFLKDRGKTKRILLSTLPIWLATLLILAIANKTKIINHT